MNSTQKVFSQKHWMIDMEETEIKELIKISDQLIKDSLLSVEQARQILIDRYGKRSRYLLNPNEWTDWLNYLRLEVKRIELLPSLREYETLALVEAEYLRLGWTKRDRAVELLRKTKRMALRSLLPQELKLWLKHLRFLPTPNKKDDRLDRPFIHPYQEKGV